MDLRGDFALWNVQAVRELVVWKGLNASSSKLAVSQLSYVCQSKMIVHA
jgi:hypothetical protein